MLYIVGKNRIIIYQNNFYLLSYFPTVFQILIIIMQWLAFSMVKWWSQIKMVFADLLPCQSAIGKMPKLIHDGKSMINVYSLLPGYE